MKNKIFVLVGILVLAIILILVITPNNKVSGIEVEMYKSPTCGCCVGHADS